ncbi:MAG: hypothetical protein DYG84_02915 [Candidatus Brocadia sp. AMX3]|nr:hypothetical protein [Candidatus Brocadia sp. AMX3]
MSIQILKWIFHSAAQPQPNFLYESGEIASEKALTMTVTMHFDGTRHVVIASEAKQSFTHKKRYLLKDSNTINNVVQVQHGQTEFVHATLFINLNIH